MSSVEGTYFDGQTSTPRRVRVHVADGLLHLDGDERATAYPLASVTLEPRLGGLERRLDLPGGASCLVPAAFELPVPADAPQRVERWVNELEMHWGYAAIAAAALVLCLWGAVAYGVPAAANLVARRMSPSLEQRMGAQTLGTLDRVALQPSKLTEDRRRVLTARFDALVRLAGAEGEYVLAFRSSPAVGPNAFALPGGTIVLLDELVAAARHDDEIVAVLAHEIGHLRERHTMRHVLQTSAAGVLLAAVVGDLVSATSYAAALPAFLLNAQYSRAFEREADRFGFDLMDRAGVGRAHFVEFLDRLEKERGGAALPGWLSTHPGAAERGESAGR